MAGAETETAAERDPELDSIADELYELHPDTFAAARDERVKQSRAAGQAPLARELAKLRRPTMSAWVVNLIWRDQHEAMEQLFELAEALTLAQASMAGAELRALLGQRRQLEVALLRRGEMLARERGVTVSASVAREVQETLAAALASPEVADEVRTGRLTKPIGVGDVPAVPPAATRPRPAVVRAAAPPPPTPIRPSVAPSAGKAARAAAQDREETARAAREREREEEAARAAREREEAEVRRAEETARREAAARRETARRRLTEAREAAQAAADAVADDTRAADAALEYHQALLKRLERLREQLREVEANAASAEGAAQTAARQRDESTTAHQAALEVLTQAERTLEQLGDAD
jgi:hypothetical protein